MNSVSLYVHIPFCLQKCDYCDFFSLPCKGVKDQYVQALVNEGKFYAKAYGIYSWKTLYAGGGTPSLLTPEQMAFLLEGLSSACPGKIKGEATFELNPETVSPEKLLTLKEHGINRISLGVQSLCNKALSAINRHASLEKTLAGLEIVKNHWQGRLNLDMIAGLPGQSEEEFLSGLEKILAYNPDHISLYSLMIEEGTPLYDKIENGLEWDDDEADRQWLKGRDFLENKGYHQYEVSNFARNNDFSAHNLQYWRQKNYIGIGSGASGSIYPFDLNETSEYGIRWTNSLSIEKYISFFAELDVDKLSKDDCISLLEKDLSLENASILPREKEKLNLSVMEEEFFMMGLRTLEGVNGEVYRKRYASLKPHYGSIEKRLGCEKNGLFYGLEKEGKAVRRKNPDNSFNYALTPEGILFLNSILLELME